MTKGLHDERVTSEELEYRLLIEQHGISDDQDKTSVEEEGRHNEFVAGEQLVVAEKVGDLIGQH